MGDRCYLSMRFRKEDTTEVCTFFHEDRNDRIRDRERQNRGESVQASHLAAGLVRILGPCLKVKAAHPAQLPNG